MNCIKTLSSYRAVNTLRLGSKQQSVKEVWGNIIDNSDLSILQSHCRNCVSAYTLTWIEDADNRGNWFKLQSPGLVFGRWMVRNSTGTSDIVTEVFHEIYQQPIAICHGNVRNRHTPTSFQILTSLFSTYLKPIDASRFELVARSLNKAEMQDLRFSQRCHWRLTPSGMLHFSPLVSGSRVPKDIAAFVCKGQSLEETGSTISHPITHCLIPKLLIPKHK